jgi:predicted ArsR family transcriptional regulator
VSTILLKKIFLCFIHLFYYNVPMQSTRQHILDYLKAQRSASAQELSLVFGMTRANLRHHLKKLQAASLVEIINERHQPGRGRPEQIYALSGETKRDQTHGLANALLAEMANPVPPKRERTRLKRLALRLIGKISQPDGNLTQRLVTAAKTLSEKGYQPRWEARPGGPEIVLGKCPYSKLVAEHPQLCQMDAYLIQHLLDEKVKQTSKLEPGPEGLPQCVFQLQTPS